MRTNVVVLSFDVMPLSLLGCYGNEWVLTPHFDQLAWEGVTFDQNFATDVAPERRQLAWWTGSAGEPKLGEFPDAQTRMLFRLLHELPCALHVEPVAEPVKRPKKSVMPPKKNRKSPFERLLQIGLSSFEVLGERGSSSLLWLHYDGISAPFDPPPKYLELYLDELEDLPGDQRSLDLIHAAASVSHLDHLFGHFRTQYEERFDGEEFIWIVTAAGSCPVGFEPNEGCAAGRISEGYIHTPLIIASSRGASGTQTSAPTLISEKNAGTRRQQLTQTIDLLPTLVDFFDIDWEDAFEGKSLLPLLKDAAGPGREKLFIYENQRAGGVRTPTEFLICRAPQKPGPRHSFADDAFGSEILLYRKPEDRWEQNDVSRMEPDLTSRLSQQILPAPR